MRETPTPLDAPKPARRAIVNADDFGQSAGVNRGIIEAHEDGVVTSASLMVRWPAAGEAAAYARRRARLSVGLHVDLGEWTYRDGAWVTLYEVAARGDRAAIEREARAQLAAFRELVGAPPTHLDSHQHVHGSEPARSILVELAQELGVPLRSSTPGVRFCGDFYGQSHQGAAFPEGIAIERLVTIIEGLAPGTTEIACHPGYADDLDTSYRCEREIEVRTLCDPRARAALAAAAVELCSFHDLRAPASRGGPSAVLG